MDLVFAYITAKNFEEARKIGKHLVKERLVACVNIIPKINSFYFWEKKMQDNNEAAIIAKTRKGKENNIIKEVKKIHSYDVPCILFIPIAGGNKEYLDWVKKEVKGKGKK